MQGMGWKVIDLDNVMEDGHSSHNFLPPHINFVKENCMKVSIQFHCMN